jgi:hypothetical protein
MAYPPDFLTLFGEDEGAARAQAQALAEAMGRRRAAGTVASIIGGPFARAGQAFLGDAGASQNDLMQAGAARMVNRLQRDRMDAYAPDFEAQAADRAARLGLQRENLGLQRQRLLQPKPVAPPKPEKPPDTSKRYLGEYLSPAAQDLPDAQRTDILNNLAGPGAEWIDQMAELSALLDVAGDAPSPTQLADIQRLIAAGLTKQNKVAGLGALSGPDMDILKKAGGSVGDLTNFLGQATGLRDLRASVRSAAERGAKDIQIRAGGVGSTPVPGKPLDFSTFDTRASEYRKKWAAPKGAAKGKRPTRTVEGETREWDGAKWVPVGSP